MMRTQWVEKRWSDSVRTQMHYARKAMVTEEMEYVANREQICPGWSATKSRAGA